MLWFDAECWESNVQRPLKLSRHMPVVGALKHGNSPCCMIHECIACKVRSETWCGTDQQQQWWPSVQRVPPAGCHHSPACSPTCPVSWGDRFARVQMLDGAIRK